MTATKHNPRRCTTCRDYAAHEKAKRGPGNWVARLGTVHHTRRRVMGAPMACGRPRRPGMIWTLDRRLATCRNCKRAARAEGRR